MFATPTTSSPSNRPLQFQPPLTPILSSPPGPLSTTSTHHAYVPLIPSPLSPRSVKRKGSRDVGKQQQQWRNLRHQSLSSPPGKPSQEDTKGVLYHERPFRDIRVGNGNGSKEVFGSGSGSGSGSGPRFGISSSSSSSSVTNFMPLPSPSSSPLSSPLSRSPSSSLFSWEMNTGKLASAAGVDGGGSENSGSYTAAAEEAIALPQQRVYRPNPLLRSRDAVAQRRRGMFLNKIRLGRDECRWGDRGDQILRLDFVADKKRWEAELARTAPEVPPEADYEYKDEMDTCRQGYVPLLLRNDLQQQQQRPKPQHLDNNGTNFNRPNDTRHGFTSLFRNPAREDQEREEAERIAQREKQELEALVALMEDDGQQQQQKQHQTPQRRPAHQEQPSKIGDVDEEEDLDGLLMGYASSKDLGTTMLTTGMAATPPSQQQSLPLAKQGQDRDLGLGYDRAQAQAQAQIQGYGDDEMDTSLG